MPFYSDYSLYLGEEEMLWGKMGIPSPLLVSFDGKPELEIVLALKTLSNKLYPTIPAGGPVFLEPWGFTEKQEVFGVLRSTEENRKRLTETFVLNDVVSIVTRTQTHTVFLLRDPLRAVGAELLDPQNMPKQKVHRDGFILNTAKDPKRHEESLSMRFLPPATQVH